VAGVAVGAWSFMKDLPWPVIVTIGLVVIVHTMYLVVFPGFIRLINVGVKARPNPAIWRHKKQFELYQAAGLLADTDPVANDAQMSGDVRAWYEQLCDAVESSEIPYVKGVFDDQHIMKGKYFAYEHTVVTKESLKKFCESRNRKPEFLS
jgi:hypothetical protein